MVAGLALLIGIGVAAVVAAVGDGGGSSLSEDDVVGRCVWISEDQLVRFAPAGCGIDTPVVVARVFDPDSCGGDTVAARLTEAPDLIVCLALPTS